MPNACGPNSPSVYVTLLNWIGWGDTRECLESVFRSDYPDFEVIVCDNGSEDEFVDHLEAWTDGVVDVAAGCRHQRLARFSFLPAPKPIPYVVHGRGAAEADGGASDSAGRLILIETGGKLVAATPNIASYGHRRFGSFCLALDPPRHLHLFHVRHSSESRKRQALVTMNYGRLMEMASFIAAASLDIQRYGRHIIGMGSTRSVKVWSFSILLLG